MIIFPIKCVILGDSTVGKTSIIRRYFYNHTDDQEQSTIGAMFLQKMITLDDETCVQLQFWDTAGQERYKSLVPMYIKGAHIVLITYDITNKHSFESIDKWVGFLNHREDIKIILISNKNDLAHAKMVSNVMGKDKADEIDAKFFDVSAKKDTNINKLFDCIIKTGKTVSKSVPLKQDKSIIKITKLDTGTNLLKSMADTTNEYLDSMSSKCCNIQ